jgi:hypothetical protein
VRDLPAVAQFLTFNACCLLEIPHCVPDDVGITIFGVLFDNRVNFTQRIATFYA